MPINSKIVGSIAATNSAINKDKCLLEKTTINLTESEFNTKLFVARKIAENEIYKTASIPKSNIFIFQVYTIGHLIYKGLLVPEDIDRFYLGLYLIQN